MTDGPLFKRRLRYQGGAWGLSAPAQPPRYVTQLLPCLALKAASAAALCQRRQALGTLDFLESCPDAEWSSRAGKHSMYGLNSTSVVQVDSTPVQPLNSGTPPPPPPAPTPTPTPAPKAAPAPASTEQGFDFGSYFKDITATPSKVRGILLESSQVPSLPLQDITV